MKKIAIIGTSIGQKGLYLSAKKMGIKSIGFSIPNNTNDFCQLADEHYNVSILEIDKIVEVCKKIGVDGVVSNGSDLTARCANEIAYKLDLPCIAPGQYAMASNKHYVREATQYIEELGQVRCRIYDGNCPDKYPVIIKPQTAGGKSGLSIATDDKSFRDAIKYAKEAHDCEILIEDYIEGLELSVETLSSNGKHYVIQTCEADTTGEPHFVEIAHHMPAAITKEVNEKINRIVPQILNAIGFCNGATDTEMKVDKEGNIFLIEVNLRGAGGNITNDLLELSTGYNYLHGLIEVSIGCFTPPTNLSNDFVGDYYLCKQTEHLLPLFANSKGKDWLVTSTIASLQIAELKDIKTNGDREGYIIYKSDHKIGLNDVDSKCK